MCVQDKPLRQSKDTSNSVFAKKDAPNQSNAPSTGKVFTKNKTCIIVGASPQTKLPLNFAEICNDNDLLIAADGGYSFCKERGVMPDIVIADFDSLKPNSIDKGTLDLLELHVLPQEKDDTDLIASCKEGLARGCTKFYLYGVSGADEGHTFASIQTLNFLAKRGARGFICTNSQLIYIIKPEDGLVPVYTLCNGGLTQAKCGAIEEATSACDAIKRAECGTRTSIFSLGEHASGVVEHGLKWELEDATLGFDFPLGVSNVVTSNNACIGLSSGTLLIITGE